MSFIVTRMDSGRTEILTNYEDISTNNNSNIYQTKIEFNIQTMKRETSLGIANIDMSSSSLLRVPPVTEAPSIGKRGVEFTSSHLSDSCDDECDIKVETKSCGTISQLISQFNKVETNSKSLPVNDSKIPPKKLRLDPPKNITATAEKMEVSASERSRSCQVQQERVHLPLVSLKFRVHGEDSPQLQRLDSAENGVVTKQKGPAPKPLAKPRFSKNRVNRDTSHQPDNNRPFLLPIPKSSDPNEIIETSQDSNENSHANIQDSNHLTYNPTDVEIPPPVAVNQVRITTPHNKSSNNDDIIDDSKVNVPMESGEVNSINEINVNETSSESSHLINTVKRHMATIDEHGITKPDSVKSKEQIINNVTKSSLKLIPKMKANSAREEQRVITCDLENDQENDPSLNVKNVTLSMDIVHKNESSATGVSRVSTYDSCDGAESSNVNDRINMKLHVLKSELAAMRKMDLVLLRQLININQSIQRIHRSDVPKISRSLTLLNSKKGLNQRRYRPVERQNSAPHCVDRRRFLFSNLRASTEDNYTDSLSSFDESEADSPSEIEASNSSLNSVLTTSPRPATNRRRIFQSRDGFLSLDSFEDPDQDYEEILRRNVRLWKMGYQGHESLEDNVDVWF